MRDAHVGSLAKALMVCVFLLVCLFAAVCFSQNKAYGSPDSSEPPYVTLTGRFQVRTFDEQLDALPNAYFVNRDYTRDEFKGYGGSASYQILEFDSPVKTTISTRTENTGTGTDGTTEREIFCCELPKDLVGPDGQHVDVRSGQTITVKCHLYTYAGTKRVAFDDTWAADVEVLAIDGVSTGVAPSGEPSKKASSLEYEVQTKSLPFCATGGNEIHVDVEWGGSLFDEDASKFNRELAKAALVLSQAAETSPDRVEEVLHELGIDEQIWSYAYSSDEDATYDPAVTFAYTRADFNGTQKLIFVICVRGTNPDDKGDVYTDAASVTDGFRTAFTAVRSRWAGVKNAAITDNDSKEDIIFFVVGHSLGGAVADQMAEYCEAYAERENIFTYTFGAANCDTLDNDINDYTNIHNIVNLRDSVPTVPWGYQKYGHRWFYDSHDKAFSETLSALEGDDVSFGEWLVHDHLCTTYLACLLTQDPYNLGDAKYDYSWRSVIHCPVDIEVLDESENVICWSEGDEVFYREDLTTTPGLLLAAVDGSKYIDAAPGINYTIRFTGTGEGTMSYTQILFDAGTMEERSQKSFSDVAISEGKTFATSFEGDRDAKSVRLLVTEGGKPVKEVLEDGSEVSYSSGSPVILIAGIVAVVAAAAVAFFIIRKKRKGKTQSL